MYKEVHRVSTGLFKPEIAEKSAEFCALHKNRLTGVDGEAKSG